MRAPGLPGPYGAWAALQRVRFRGGPPDGVLFDLPDAVADARPGRITVTPSEKVYDQERQRQVPNAWIIDPPAARR